MSIKKKIKRCFDKDDEYFGLFYHLVICFVFVLIGVIIILTFKPFNYITFDSVTGKYVDYYDGIWDRISSGGAYLAFGLGWFFLYLSIVFWDVLKDRNRRYKPSYLFEFIGILLMVFSFVCVAYNMDRPFDYIDVNLKYVGTQGKGYLVGRAVESLLSPASKAKYVFFNPAFPLIFAVSMFSYAATTYTDRYVGRLIAIVISIVVSYVAPLIMVLIQPGSGMLIVIIVYAVLFLIGVLGIVFNVNSNANFEFGELISKIFGRSSSGRTSSGGATGCVRYSADAEKCVIDAMNSVKGITTSTSLGYGVKVKFYPNIYVDRASVTITVNYSLSGGEGLTENKLQDVQRQFSAAAQRYSENISKRAKERYGKCKSQRSYTLNIQIGSNM